MRRAQSKKANKESKTLARKHTHRQMQVANHVPILTYLDVLCTHRYSQKHTQTQTYTDVHMCVAASLPFAFSPAAKSLALRDVCVICIIAFVVVVVVVIVV